LVGAHDGSNETDISAEVTFGDSRKGTISARVKIRSMKTEPIPAMGKAA
jgi:long-chain acyl-CoA synthetase